MVEVDGVLEADVLDDVVVLVDELLESLDVVVLLDFSDVVDDEELDVDFPASRESLR